MKHTIRKINKAFFKGSPQTLEAYLIDDSELFYILIENETYLVFEDIEAMFKYRESNGIRINCFEITGEQYNDDNYLISLFVKDYTRFTDWDLIKELRNRNYALAVFSIVDVDKIISELKGIYTNIFLSDSEKLEVVKSTIEDREASIEALRQAIIKKYQEGLPF